MRLVPILRTCSTLSVNVRRAAVGAFMHRNLNLSFPAVLPTEEPVAQLEPEKKDPKAKGGKVTAGQAAVVTTEWRSHYVLLLDQVFGDLPLESCLPFGDVASISRDFHIQMFVRRLRSISASPSAVSNESAAAAPGGAKKKGTATGTETSSKPEIVDRFEMDLSKLSCRLCVWKRFYTIIFYSRFNHSQILSTRKVLI